MITSINEFKKINEAGDTEFGFDPLKYESAGLNVENDEQFYNGRRVGNKYIFSKPDINIEIVVCRVYHDNNVDNYMISISVTNYKNSTSLDPEQVLLKLNALAGYNKAGSIHSNTYTNISYTKFGASQTDAENILDKFVKFN
jgi:hypothetical protein